MEYLGKILEILQWPMEVPAIGGWYHLMCVLIVIAATVFLCLRYKDCSQKKFNRIVMILWIVMAVLELYKQVVFSFSYTDGVLQFDYAWYAFPFQLCSTPLYVMPFVCFLKEGKWKDIVMSYTMTFAFFGGLAVMTFPGDVYIDWIGINIQTMVHHGIQVVAGVFCLVYNRKRLNPKFWMKGVYLFGPLVLVAFGLNIMMYHLFQANGIEEAFNMFYIGPYFDCTLPLLSLIYPKVPYIVFFLLYLLGFTLISYLIYNVALGIYKVAQKKNENK